MWGIIDESEVKKALEAEERKDQQEESSKAWLKEVALDENEAHSDGAEVSSSTSIIDEQYVQELQNFEDNQDYENSFEVIDE